MSDEPTIVQRPPTFKDWHAERYPNYHFRPHVGQEVWFTGGFTSINEDVEHLGNALSQYLDEQLTKQVR